MVGVAAFCRAVPMMAFGPFAGVLADRLPRVRRDDAPSRS